MNKKVLTLCAGLLLAGSSVAFAAVSNNYVVGTTVKNAVSGYTFVGMADGFNQFTADQSSWASNDNFPHVSPFPILEKYGAKRKCTVRAFGVFPNNVRKALSKSVLATLLSVVATKSLSLKSAAEATSTL